MYIQNVNLDVNAQPDANAKPCLRLSQNENGRVLMMRIIGVDIPEGSTANFAGLKPDGNVYSKPGTVDGNVVSIEEDIQMTAVSGSWNAKIAIVNDGNTICTARIRVVVDASLVPGDAIPSDSQLDGIVAECQAYAESAKSAAYGSPLTANTAADMTDQNRVYVYTGSETGYTAGHWYYYDGSAWTDGGVYNAVAVQTDTTLTQAGKAADAKETGDQITELKEDLSDGYTRYPATTNGSFGASGVTTGTENRIRTELISFSAGDVIVIENGTMQHGCGMWQSSVSSANIKRNDNAFIATGETISPDYNGFIVVVFRNGDNSNLSPSAFDGSVKKYPSLMKQISDILPFFKTSDINFINGYYYNTTNHQLQSNADYSYVKLDVSLFRGGHISGTTSVAPNSSYGIAFVDKADTFISGISSTNTGSYVFEYDLEVPDNAESIYISCRNAGKASTWFGPTYSWDVVLNNIRKQGINIADVTNGEVDHKLKNARHIISSSNDPLTILHFTDLHGDTSALARIMDDATLYAQNIDEYICTGDMVPNTATQIASWWDEKVLICIGNHDTASYSGGVYNWTALSMADRDAYYIAPFESGWGIIHTSGTSYYYKDYSDSKVRMIVMDCMLYTDNGAEATAQTSWLATLLADAITNNLHVLIAIHAPHGGAKAIECSFTEYGASTMPTYSDCNTPQSVIDAVATAIGNGLKFIGYIVGHTHHDVVWDAENDGTQIMYCPTCACVNNVNQWINADLYRGADADAFNIVTIDTTRTIVKIVRGGGADIDDHMRTRKAICFNYSTGEIVGEVL